MKDYMELEKTYEFNVYPKREIVLVRGKNAKVWDHTGREYIDCVAGHGVVNIGHCNEKVIHAISRQVQQLITCSGIFFNDIRSQLLEKLVHITPENLKRFFLCNSGTESVEAAIKFSKFTSKKSEFICAMKGFHGRTMGSLSATFNPKYRDDFKPLIPGFHFVPFNNIKKLSEKINNNTCAIILEIVQGEGGVNIGNKSYFQKVRELCDRNKIILIIDEIQTGFCRTGKMFAVNHFEIKPDIMCVAKALGGGFPIGAVCCSEKIEVPMGKHGSTFGGNPLASAAAIAAIDFMVDNKLDQQAREKGVYILDKLKKTKLKGIREIRGLGLMIGIELREKVKPFILKLIEESVLTLPAGSTVLRLLPPLTISYEELDFVIEKIEKVLNSD